jgi:hypothetical protein
VYEEQWEDEREMSLLYIPSGGAHSRWSRNNQGRQRNVSVYIHNGIDIRTGLYV